MISKKIKLLSLIIVITLSTTYAAVTTYEKAIDYKEPGETVFTITPDSMVFDGAAGQKPWYKQTADKVMDFFSPTKLLIPVLVIFPENENLIDDTQAARDFKQTIDQTSRELPQHIASSALESRQSIDEKPKSYGGGSGSWGLEWKINIYDDNTPFGKKGETASLDIFSTSKDIYRKKLIYPGISGKYIFTIDNSYNSYNMKYSVAFSKQGVTEIPMVYRLKNKDGYLGEENKWYDIDGLNTLIVEAQMKKKEKLSYILEWKWSESENDNIYIKYGGQKYILKITVHAEAQ